MLVRRGGNILLSSAFRLFPPPQPENYNPVTDYTRLQERLLCAAILSDAGAPYRFRHAGVRQGHVTGVRDDKMVPFAASPMAYVSGTLTVSERRRRYPHRIVASHIVGRGIFQGWS